MRKGDMSNKTLSLHVVDHGIDPPNSTKPQHRCAGLRCISHGRWEFQGERWCWGHLRTSVTRALARWSHREPFTWVA